MAARPTLEVVAARAGVSRATASRVLRGATNVSPQARDAVLRAAHDLAYTVNHAARSLVTRRSDSIAFLVAENEDRMFNDPYFHGVLRGAQAEAASLGVQLVFAIASTALEREQFVHFVGGGHVDGVLVVSPHSDDSLAGELEATGVPAVVNGRPFAGESHLYSVDSDNIGGGRSATDWLLRRGARAVTSITGPLDMSAGQDRLIGFRNALTDAGLSQRMDATAEGDFTVDGGARAMAELLRADPDLDAVFVASDLMALGALRTLVEHGRRVPDDVALVGFDDVREAQLATPPLTTVRQPLEGMGRTMTRVLLARTHGGVPAQRTVLDTELVLRRSA